MTEGMLDRFEKKADKRHWKQKKVAAKEPLKVTAAADWLRTLKMSKDLLVLHGYQSTPLDIDFNRLYLFFTNNK